MTNSSTAATYTETVKTFWDKMNQTVKPESITYKYTVHLRDRRTAEYEFKIYPAKEETKKTADERVNFWANFTYPDVLRIEFVGMQEFV